MDDRYDDTPLHDQEGQRRANRDAEQIEWENEPDYELYFPKPSKRVRASRNEWDHMRAAFLHARCAVCGGDWHSLHHIYKRSQGGDDVYGNLLPLCGSGTTGCHGLVEAHDPAARAAVRAKLDEVNHWYLTYKLGHGARAWLDSQYPELEVAA